MGQVRILHVSVQEVTIMFRLVPLTPVKVLKVYATNILLFHESLSLYAICPSHTLVEVYW